MAPYGSHNGERHIKAQTWRSKMIHIGRRGKIVNWKVVVRFMPHDIDLWKISYY
jgi:hypothetical protein